MRGTRTPTAIGAFNDFGGERDPVDREALARGPLRNDHNGQLIVELVADGRPIGTVGWHRVGLRAEPRIRGVERRDRAHPRGARPRLRHRGAGPARRVPVRQHRREPGRGLDRHREHGRATRRSRRPAIVREGVVRGSQFRAGAYHDLVTYSRLRRRAVAGALADGRDVAQDGLCVGFDQAKPVRRRTSFRLAERPG